MPFSDHVVANFTSVCPPCYGPPCYTILIGIVPSDKCYSRLLIMEIFILYNLILNVILLSSKSLIVFKTSVTFG